jgi:nucleotide-binding universal stress UspA family protein
MSDGMRLLIIRTVLVATDLEPSSRDALETAHRLATLAGASLHAVHVMAPARAGGSETARGKAVEDVRAALRGAGVAEEHATVHVVPGAPAEAIRALADRISADVVVIGPHRRRAGITGEQALGSTARRIVERAYAPCLIVGQQLRLPLRRVLVPTDFSETASGALLVGLSWASGLRTRDEADGATTLTALHVDAATGEASRASPASLLEDELEELRREGGSWAGVTMHGVTEQGEQPAETIERFAVRHRSDVVVIGTRGAGTLEDSRLGSVSAMVAIRSEVPTLLVPPAVWRTHAGVR